jgi:hypothetical protein
MNGKLDITQRYKTIKYIDLFLFLYMWIMPTTTDAQACNTRHPKGRQK